MLNSEIEQVPDLEHVKFAVKNLEIREINGKRIIEALLEKIGSVDEVQNIRDQIGEFGEDGSFDVKKDIYEDYDKPEIREAVGKFLAERPDFQKAA